MALSAGSLFALETPPSMHQCGADPREIEPVTSVPNGTSITYHSSGEIAFSPANQTLISRSGGNIRFTGQREEWRLSVLTKLATRPDAIRPIDGAKPAD